jgi:probable F420-dependent oxidoreductase
LLADFAVADVRAVAGVAEAAGARRLWLADTAGPELGATAGALGATASALAATTGLELGFAVASVFTRTPAVLAMSTSTIAQISGRPFHLGIATGGQAIVERWNGLDYRQTVERTRDAIAILRSSFAGERTDRAGDVLSSHGFALDRPPGAPVAVYVGALGERVTALACAAADGMILSWSSPRILRGAVASARVAVAGLGRDPESFPVVGRMYACLTDDPEAVRERVRRELFSYLVSPPYARFFRRHGFAIEVESANRALKAGDRAASLRAVSDVMLDELLHAGSPAEIRRRAEEHWAAGIDDLMLQPVATGDVADAAATVRAVF